MKLYKQLTLALFNAPQGDNATQAAFDGLLAYYESCFTAREYAALLHYTGNKDWYNVEEMLKTA